MHFIVSLLLLLLTIGLIYLYFLLPYLLYVWLKLIRRNKRARKQGEKYEPEFFWNKKRKKTLVSLAIFICVASLTVYIGQRAKWMGDDNGNFKAKNYYVAGQVLNSFRNILTTFIHPEIPVMAPLRELQWLIYNQGIKNLPASDGEIGVWQNQWFHYHYSKKNRQELFLKNSQPTKTMRARLDQWWFCLETMATGSYNDKQMQEEHYFLDYPSLALSYYLTKGFYAHHAAGSLHSLALMPKHVERSRLLSGWLWDLQNKWKQSPKTQDFIRNTPKLEAMYLFILQAELAHYLQGLINQRQFSCNHPAARRYVVARKQFLEPDNDTAAYKRMKRRDQAKRLYRWSVDNAQAQSIKYVLTHYCDMEVAGQEDLSEFESWAKIHNLTLEQEAELAARDNFNEEVKILEEQFYEQ